MIEKNKEYIPEDRLSKVEDKDETEIPNFKFLYRNLPSSEKDKSSGVSSDDETISSLAPIPETLKFVRNKSKWTINEAADQSESENNIAGRKIQNSAENILDSLEELRRKYTLKTETSVALKMNSANMMLDEILSRSNLLKASSKTQFVKDDFNVLENESSTTGDSAFPSQHCTHAIYSTVPLALCQSRCKVIPPFQSSLKSGKKEPFQFKKDLDVNCKKKSLLEKLHDLHIKYTIKSVYKTLQKAKIPFSKNRKIDVNNDERLYKIGIPGSDYQIKGARNNCEQKKIYPQEYSKKIPSVSGESTSAFDTKSIEKMNVTNERGEKQCTCFDIKNKSNLLHLKGIQSLHMKTEQNCQCTCPEQNCQCTCPEQNECCKKVVPNCNHYKHGCKISKNHKKNYKNLCSSRASEYLSATPHTLRQDHQECSSLSDKDVNDSKNNESSSSNTKKGWKKYCFKERNLIEKIDFYYFDHGNSAYYQTTDHHPVRYTECLVEYTDEYATQFWAEIFGTIEIGVAFLISFILQFYRFLFSSIIRSLLVGFLQVFSDYFLKPLLTILFNGIIQPCLILAYNVATSFRDLCLPISQTFGFFAKEVANIFKSCKLVDCTKAMTSWTERMHRRAATFSNVVTSCGHPSVPYPRRLEKVKFGVPIDEVCKNDIPGSLLVLILKLNKEAPEKKDVFRAPGHQGNMKKLIHFLQAGRLVNLDNFSVYTIASVLKKFLRKLPGGIFGREGEQELFHVIEMDDTDEQREMIHRLIVSLPIHTQRLLVLLFGTFRVIATNSERCQTGMTSEALGVSVAPSFFQTCVSDGKQAKMEDVQRFKIATKIMKFMIDNFGVSNLFGRENYEYYARITGRILKVEEDWIYNFRYPPDCFVSPMSQQEESQSTPALIHVPEFSGDPCTSLSIIPKTNLLESYTRLSISLEENGLFKGSSRSSSSSVTSGHHMTLEELRAVNRYAESTKSLSYLPQVHERQTARMRTRSEWFLSPLIAPGQLLYAIDSDPTSIFLLRSSCSRSSADYRLLKMLTKKGGTGLSASAESIQKRPSVRRNNSRHIHRVSSKRNKENGSSKKHSPSTSLKKSHQEKIEGKSSKFNSHEAKQIKLPEETELLEENYVSVKVDRLLKESGGNKNFINIYGSQQMEESFCNLGQVQDIRLLKLSSLDAANNKTESVQSKFQKISSLESSSSVTETKSNSQLCKQLKVDELKDEDVSEMDVTTYNVTLNYKPRI